MILATSSINSLIYSSRGAEEAVAAGFILLAIVSVSKHSVWQAASATDLKTCRSFGCSISAPNLMQHSDALSTRLLFTKLHRCDNQCEARGPSRSTILVVVKDKDILRQEALSHTMPLILTALRPPRQMQCIHLESMAIRHLQQTIVVRTRSGTTNQTYIQPRPFLQEEMAITLVARPRLNILTKHEPYIPTKPIRTTQTRSASLSTKFWKSPMLVVDGGRRGRRTVKLALRRATTSFFFDGFVAISE